MGQQKTKAKKKRSSNNKKNKIYKNAEILSIQIYFIFHKFKLL